MSSKESKEEIPTSILSLECSTKTLVDEQKSISIKAKVLLNNLELMHKSHTSFFKDIKTLSSSKDQQDEWLMHFDQAFCVCQTLYQMLYLTTYSSGEWQNFGSLLGI